MMKIIECPRDAMQGISKFIATEDKAKYINKLLTAGFDTIDFGSFVSSKAIPQMADTAEVLSLLDLQNSNTKLLSIIANERGAEQACLYPQINYLGFPFSVSETFQQRNTGGSIAEAVTRVKNINNLAKAHNKETVVYLSMGFGNPYGDHWDIDILHKWLDELASLGINTFSISDTVGLATNDIVNDVFTQVQSKFETLEIGAHLHSRPDNAPEKIKAAYTAGVRRFDTAIAGYGGCPMAGDGLVGNISTRTLLAFLNQQQVQTLADQQYINELEANFLALVESNENVIEH
ncbi:MAG: hydroxymethylglutaryl-CoA lyase [Mucilaginibacter sp.]|nr:hydroxymethylglutaryl-CoA lyase [Mucilaginibacter sp.]